MAWMIRLSTNATICAAQFRINLQRIVNAMGSQETKLVRWAPLSANRRTWLITRDCQRLLLAARQQTGPIKFSLNEGFDTVDPKEAKALFEELSCPKVVGLSPILFLLLAKTGPHRPVN